LQHQQPAAFLGEGAHEIEDAVDDASGHIAAQSAQEYDAHLFPASFGHVQRAGKGEDHDEIEKDFRDPVMRIEDALGGLMRIVDHAI